MLKKLLCGIPSKENVSKTKASIYVKKSKKIKKIVSLWKSML